MMRTIQSLMLSTLVLSTFAVAALLGSAARGAEPKTELLWPKGAPDANGDEAKDKPTLIIYLPDVEQAKEKEARGAVVVCPGGGYGGLAIDHEGHQIAKWLNENGLAAFICDYRHRGRGYGHPAPLQDAHRAIRTVRARAEEFGVDPTKVGILGFSAGGHLTSSALTHFDKGDEKAEDSVMRQSSRPDFGVLCYPVIAFDTDFTHRGSQNNLLGADASKELIESMSSEKQVTSETPPTFLFHTFEDKAVPPQNSVVFYEACIKNNVPAELHVFEKGQHGIGLAKSISGTSAWPALCIGWLKVRGVVK
jgi:acetyl esterase/lipase